MQAELRRRAADPPWLKRRALERDGRRVLADLGILAAENSGHAQRMLGVGDHERSLRKHAVDAIERPQRFPAPRLARDEHAAPQLALVVRVQGLAELEHDVVGDVDDVVDRTHAGPDEAGLHPFGRWADANAREQRRRETRTGMVVLDADVELLRRAGPEPLERRLPETRAEQRGDLARDALDAEAVRAIGLKVEREDGLAEDLAEERADRQLGVEDVDPLVLVTEAELLSRQHHALALDPAHGLAAQGRALSGVAVDDRRAFVGIWDDRALGQIRRAGDDRLRSARAVVDGREEQLVRVRMLGDLL